MVDLLTILQIHWSVSHGTQLRCVLSGEVPVGHGTHRSILESAADVASGVLLLPLAFVCSPYCTISLSPHFWHIPLALCTLAIFPSESTHRTHRRPSALTASP
jgi:hypothetical protein